MKMSRKLRTFIAVIAAPSAASLVVAAVGPFWGPSSLVTGSYWERAVRYFYLASLVSYTASFTVGTLTFLFLKLLRRESFVYFLVVGGATGFLYGMYWAVRPGYTFDRIAARLFFALLGVIVGATFSLIRGNKPEPNQALQHNDPSSHVSCLRTPRASRDRG